MPSNSEIQPSPPDLQALFHADVAQRTAQRQQNFLLGFLAGFMAMLAGSGLWVTIAAVLPADCSFLALGVAGLVGASIRFFGRGIDWLFSAVSAVLAAMGCALGTVLTAGSALARSHHTDFWSTLTALWPASALALLQQTGPVDGMFFGLAVALGWILARRAPAPVAHQ